MEIGTFFVSQYKLVVLIFLGVNVHCKVKFNEHLGSILEKEAREVMALWRILPYMNFEKRHILTSSFLRHSSIIAYYYRCFTAEHWIIK